MAERSKALDLGSSLHWRRFESCRHHFPFPFCKAFRRSPAEQPGCPFGGIAFIKSRHLVLHCQALAPPPQHDLLAHHIPGEMARRI